MATTVAKGAVVISTDTEALLAGLKKATADIQGFQTKIGNISFFGTGGIGALTAGLRTAFDSVKGLMSQISQTGDHAETITQMADAFSMSTDEMQQAAFAVGQVGVDFEKFGNILRKVTEIQQELIDGNEEVTKKIQGMGLEIKDVAGVLPLQALKNITKEQPLGKISGVLGPKMGIAGFKIGKADWEDEGVVKTAEELESLDKAGDKVVATMQRMSTAWQKVLAKLGENVVIPSLDQFNDPNSDFHLGLERIKRFIDLGGDWRKSLRKPRSESDWNDDAAFAEKAIRARDERDRKELEQEKKLKDAQEQRANIPWANQWKAEADRLGNVFDQLKDNDPVERFQKQMKDLQVAKAAGVQGADRGIVDAFGALEQAAGLSGQVNIPSAMIAGGAEDIRARQQDRADAMFGGPENTLSNILDVLEKQEAATQQLAPKYLEALRQNNSALAKKIKEALNINEDGL